MLERAANRRLLGLPEIAGRHLPLDGCVRVRVVRDGDLVQIAHWRCRRDGAALREERAHTHSVISVLHTGLERSGERLAEVARACACSPFHLCRVFRAHRGTTLGSYARRLRLAAVPPSTVRALLHDPSHQNLETLRALGGRA